jgi:polyisoprenoid-binding protein YceI
MINNPIKSFTPMKSFSFAAMAASMLLLSAFTTYQSMDWTIATGYSITFKSENPSGVFSKMSGDISFDEKDLANSKMNVKVDVTSINTGNGMKNKHAKSDKWFDAKKYPNITFTSTSFSKSATGYQVKGTMEIHGIKKEVTIPFTFKNNVFAGAITVNRLDYKIGTTEGMSAKVPANLAITISVPVTKK